MRPPTLADGTVHALPPDFRQALEGDASARRLWGEITPLARNEWICWVTSAKKDETRRRRVEVGVQQMRRHAQTVLLAGLSAPLKVSAERRRGDDGELRATRFWLACGSA